MKIDILKTKIYEDGSEAYLKEQSILKTFNNYQYKGDGMSDFIGYTELFYTDISKI